ncbi:60 kDa jasmonate-induced protein-like [Hordeum vulgare subsp. vulgare]|uniref:rRNA N-glycosylase n=1 Tax=Hordeum vulgare subsp. vulgare TaxID=112509 RepID=A0A8I6XVN3_HORVV|nr:60 kDa jasmonate-induced protein-like [Hordeum vulgare subsp. vulgare]
MEGSTMTRLAGMAAFLLILGLAVGNIKHGHGGAVVVGDPTLIVVELQGHNDDKSSVAVQKHDVSVAGFTDGSGHWHAFPGLDHLFPASTTLPFGSSYSELIGGIANLPGVPLGREAMMQAIRVLSAYRPGADVEPVKRALAAVKVVISEAQRLEPIRKAVNDGWDGESRVAPEHLPYIEHWDTMSYEILRSNRTGKWDGPFTKMLETQANIRSKEEALAVVGLLLNADFEKVFKAHAIPINLE